jgi:hypothetical protein
MVFSRYAVVLVLLFSTGSSISFPQAEKSKSSQGLKLTAHRIGSAIPKLNGTFLYTADLSNESGVPVTVEAVQMPGGYAGDGQFFACSLQTWDDRDQRWIVQRRAKLSEFGKSPNLKTLEAKPGEHLDVCGMYLPSQARATATGDCARFLFQTRWNGAASLRIYSDTFIIGKPASSNNRSCATSEHSTNSLLHESGHVLEPPQQQ